MKKVERLNKVSNITLLFALIALLALGVDALREKFYWLDFGLALGNLVVSIAFKITAHLREKNLFF